MPSQAAQEALEDEEWLRDKASKHTQKQFRVSCSLIYGEPVLEECQRQRRGDGHGEEALIVSRRSSVPVALLPCRVTILSDSISSVTYLTRTGLLRKLIGCLIGVRDLSAVV